MRAEHTHLAALPRYAPGDHPLPTESGRIVLGSRSWRGWAMRIVPTIRHGWTRPNGWAAATGTSLHLISHQPRGRLHSQLETGAASLADRRGGREQLRLNPEDAQARGIQDGQTVRLRNARGARLATARISPDTAPGVAVLPTGAWPTRGRTAPTSPAIPMC